MRALLYHICQIFVRRKSKPFTKDWVRKSQIRKVSHLRNVCKSNKLFKSANLRICDLRNLPADRPHLHFFNATVLKKAEKLID